MKLGMPTLVEYNTVEEAALLCNSLGLQFVELNLSFPYCLPERVSIEELRNIQQKYNIEFTIHLPEELDLSSFQPIIRAANIKRCIELMEWASLAGITTLNMHINKGIHSTLPHKIVWLNELYEEDFYDLLIDSYSILSAKAKKLGINLCIENTGNFHLPFIQKALATIMKLDNVYLTWDVGHDAMVDFQEEAVFMQYISRVKHMHLHDYNGKSDHQVLYSGIVPIDSRLKIACDRELSVVIEVKTTSSLKESVKKSQGFLNK